MNPPAEVQKRQAMPATATATDAEKKQEGRGEVDKLKKARIAEVVQLIEHQQNDDQEWADLVAWLLDEIWSRGRMTEFELDEWRMLEHARTKVLLNNGDPRGAEQDWERNYGMKITKRP